MANQSRRIELAPAERAALDRLVRATRAPAGLTRRARAVVLMADGLPGVEVARRTEYTPVQISRLRRCCATERLVDEHD